MIYQCCHENRKAAVMGNRFGMHRLLESWTTMPYRWAVSANARIGALSQPRRRLVCACRSPDHRRRKLSTGITRRGSASPLRAADNPLGERECISDFARPERSQGDGDSHQRETATSRHHTIRAWSTNCQPATEDSFDVTEALQGFDPERRMVEFASRWSVVQTSTALSARRLPTKPARASARSNYLANDYGAFRRIMLDA